MNEVLGMNYKKTFLNIIMAAIGMLIGITGIAYKTGYFQTSNPNIGYVFLGIGIVITAFFLNRLRD